MSNFRYCPSPSAPVCCLHDACHPTNRPVAAGRPAARLSRRGTRVPHPEADSHPEAPQAGWRHHHGISGPPLLHGIGQQRRHVVGRCPRRSRLRRRFPLHLQGARSHPLPAVPAAEARQPRRAAPDEAGRPLDALRLRGTGAGRHAGASPRAVAVGHRVGRHLAAHPRAARRQVAARTARPAPRHPGERRPAGVAAAPTASRLERMGDPGAGPARSRPAGAGRGVRDHRLRRRERRRVPS